MSVPLRGPLGKKQWVGSAKKPLTIEAAIADGYSLARKSYPKGDLSLQVITIYVLGTNPISEYRVKLGATTS